jgi:hypothetical protein
MGSPYTHGRALLTVTSTGGLRIIIWRSLLTTRTKCTIACRMRQLSQAVVKRSRRCRTGLVECISRGERPCESRVVWAVTISVTRRAANVSGQQPSRADRACPSHSGCSPDESVRQSPLLSGWRMGEKTGSQSPTISPDGSGSAEHTWMGEWAAETALVIDLGVARGTP